MRPQPVKGSIPIHIGGSTDIAAKRAGRLGDGFFPAGGSHEELARIIGITRESAIKHGRIVEQGSHEELLASRGAYFRLYQSQFSGAATDVD